MRAEEIEDLGDRVPRLAPRQVHRVVAAPTRVDARVDLLADLLGQRDQLEARGRAGIGGQHPPTPSGGEDDSASPTRQGLRREGRRPLEGILHRGCP